ncbi:MAG: hypothetical protein KDI62_25915 [Anaerolineae bacterium]|nr:hypothetical protein [Anaerolineae bacterium]MCB9104043.1 hypothetical protein [Anaerolineales bacterium]
MQPYLLCGTSDNMMVNPSVSVNKGGTSEADKLQTLWGPAMLSKHEGTRSS